MSARIRVSERIVQAIGVPVEGLGIMRAAGHIMLLSRARVPLKERPELQNLAVLRVDLPHKLAEIHRERRQARAGVVAQGGCAAAHPTCRAWDDAIRL